MIELNNMQDSTSTVGTHKLDIKKRIRSFVLRQGRLTKGQELALKTLWPQFGIDYNAHAPISFNTTSSVVLEIGFGMGSSLIEMALSVPDTLFLGIEVHKPGVGACMMAAGDNKLSNLKVICHDAVEVLENMISNNSIDKVQIFFPDPWHKARHHKRRIIQPQFVQLLHQKLKTGGVLHLATDWYDYAEHMLLVLNGSQGFRNLSKTSDYVPRPNDRPITKFEQRGQKLEHGVWDLQFVKLPQPN